MLWELFLVPFHWPVRYRPLHLLSYAASFSLGSNWQCKISTLLYSISFKDFGSCSNTVHVRRGCPIWTSLFSNCVYPGILTTRPVSRGETPLNPTGYHEVRLRLEAIAASINSHLKRCIEQPTSTELDRERSRLLEYLQQWYAESAHLRQAQDRLEVD